MNKNEILCQSCRHARKSKGRVMDCATIGVVALAVLYGRCRKYQPKVEQPKLFEK